MATKSGRNFWLLLLFIFSGLVIGGLLGELAGHIDFLWWLKEGQSFGLTEPIVLDLSVLQLTFGFTIKLNVASIIGLLTAVLIYRKI